MSEAQPFANATSLQRPATERFVASGGTRAVEIFVGEAAPVCSE